jgi:preprotein translocase subunit SecG
MIALMIALLVCGVFLVVAVLMQHGKSHGLSGTIAGGAETFFGKDKGSKIDKVLSRLTTIIGIVFVVLVLLVYLLNPNYTLSNKYTQDMGIPPTSSVE